MSLCAYMWFSKLMGLAVCVCVYIRLCASLYSLYMYMYVIVYYAYCFFLLLSQAVSSFTISFFFPYARVLYMFVGICIKPSAR